MDCHGVVLWPSEGVTETIWSIFYVHRRHSTELGRQSCSSKSHHHVQPWNILRFGLSASSSKSFACFRRLYLELSWIPCRGLGSCTGTHPNPSRRRAELLFRSAWSKALGLKPFRRSRSWHSSFYRERCRLCRWRHFLFQIQSPCTGHFQTHPKRSASGGLFWRSEGTQGSICSVCSSSRLWTRGWRLRCHRTKKNFIYLLGELFELFYLRPELSANCFEWTIRRMRPRCAL